MWKISNSIIATKPISHSKINGVLDVNGSFVGDPKVIGNVINKKFVSIADELIKIRTYVFCDYDEISLDSVKIDLFLRIYLGVKL